MDDSNNPTVAAAHAKWCSNEPLEAGRIIFESLPKEDRVSWAAGILKLTLDATSVNDCRIRRLQRICDDRALWSRSHRCFGALRRRLLALENRSRTKDQEMHYRVLFLAENVAKVVYDATTPVDPFDEDAGWWIVSNVHDVATFLRDDHLLALAWEAIANHS